MAKTHEEQMSTLHTAMNQQKSRIQELEKEISTITDNHELHLKQRVCHQIVRRHQIVRKTLFGDYANLAPNSTCHQIVRRHQIVRNSTIW